MEHGPLLPFIHQLQHIMRCSEHVWNHGTALGFSTCCCILGHVLHTRLYSEWVKGWGCLPHGILTCFQLLPPRWAVWCVQQCLPCGRLVYEFTCAGFMFAAYGNAGAICHSSALALIARCRCIEFLCTAGTELAMCSCHNYGSFGGFMSLVLAL